MSTFRIPAAVLAASGTMGAGAPATNFYLAKVTAIAPHASRPTARKVSLSLETGFDVNTWMNVPFDADGAVVPGFLDDNGAFISDDAKRRYSGMLAATKSLLLSAGVDTSESGGGATDADLIGANVYVEWHHADDIGAKYGEVKRFITKKAFDNNREAGRLPSVAGAGANTETETRSTAPISGGSGVPRASVPSPTRSASAVL